MSSNFDILSPKKISRAAHLLLDLFFPQSCTACQKQFTSGALSLCRPCHQTFTARRLVYQQNSRGVLEIYDSEDQNAQRCTRCAARLTKTGHCQECKEKKIFFETCWTLFPCTGISQAVFRAVKFADNENLVPYLVQQIPHSWQSIPGSPWAAGSHTTLVQLPSSRKFLTTFTHRLAERFAFETIAPFYFQGKKEKSKKVSKWRRFEILQHHLKLNLEKIKNQESTSLILVDDLYTTGATLNRAARFLKEHFPQTPVHVMTPFRRDQIRLSGLPDDSSEFKNEFF